MGAFARSRVRGRSLKGQRDHVLILKTLMSCLPLTAYLHATRSRMHASSFWKRRGAEVDRTRAAHSCAGNYRNTSKFVSRGVRNQEKNPCKRASEKKSSSSLKASFNLFPTKFEVGEQRNLFLKNRAPKVLVRGGDINWDWQASIQMAFESPPLLRHFRRAWGSSHLMDERMDAGRHVLHVRGLTGVYRAI